MAKASQKKKLLMPEEKLDEALIPNTEEPYSVPSNWCWAKLEYYMDYVTDYVANGSFASLKQNVRILKDDGYALMVKTADFSNNFSKSLTFTDKHGYEFLSKSALFGGELLLSNIGSIGKVFRVPYFNRPMTLASNSVMIKCFQEQDYDWLYYYFLSPNGYSELMKISTGTAMLKFNKTDLKSVPIPIAPAVEQKRIIKRIENLFTKLDEAKEIAQAVVDGFEDRRAAILYQAFTGILTRTWANKHGIPETSWSKKRFDEVAVIKSNLVDPEEFQNFPHIAPDNIEKKTGRLLEYHTIAEDGMKSGKHRFYPGQILYSKIRPNLSKVVIVDFDGLCSADMYPIESKEGINTKYLWYYMLSEEFLLQASTAGSRSVLPKINQKELSQLTVRITDSLEQEKIVATLDQLFEKEQQIKDNADQSLEQIEAMKKTILARAFRGELDTNDPNDESAIELLKKVLSVESTPQPRKKGVSLPKEISVKLKTELERKIVKLFIQRETDSLPVKEIMSVSSKPFEVLETLHDLEKRHIIKRVENNSNTYELMR